MIEVVVATGAMSLLLVALLSLVSLSLRNSRLAKDRAQGVALAQEGVELMRAYRDYNWTKLNTLADGTNYNLPANWVVEDGLAQSCPENRQIDEFFWRCVQLSTVAGKMEVAVSVSWKEGSQVFNTNQVGQLSLWER
ncbi:MAG: hypothetical protein U1C50_01060 [Patescibacteria group bacterium]|nr:hypothetical protein [Patescibacteria group bacterium]